MDTRAASSLKLELDANLQSIFASIRGSLPENTAAGQSPFPAQTKKFRQKTICDMKTASLTAGFSASAASQGWAATEFHIGLPSPATLGNLQRG